MERRRKPVVRLSEVMRHELDEEKENENKQTKKATSMQPPPPPQISLPLSPPSIDPLNVIAPASESLFQTLLLQNKNVATLTEQNQVYSSSPIVIQHRNKTNTMFSDETTKWNNDREDEGEEEENSNSHSYSTFGSMNSLTKVSRFVHTKSAETPVYKDKNDECQDDSNDGSYILTERECLDFVLFDGLKIKSPPPKITNSINTNTNESNNTDSSKRVIDISRAQPKRRLLLDKTNINKNLRVNVNF